MPKLSDEKIRDRIGSSIAYATEWGNTGVPVQSVYRCGGSIWLTMRDGRSFKVVVSKVEGR